MIHKNVKTKVVAEQEHMAVEKNWPPFNKWYLPMSFLVKMFWFKFYGNVSQMVQSVAIQPWLR